MSDPIKLTATVFLSAFPYFLCPPVPSRGTGRQCRPIQLAAEDSKHKNGKKLDEKG